jgi:hypothetical protein
MKSMLWNWFEEMLLDIILGYSIMDMYIYNMLCYIILYYIILFYIILYFIILYVILYIILYFILYYIISWRCQHGFVVLLQKNDEVRLKQRGAEVEKLRIKSY